METNLEYLKRWEEIANATDLIQALTRHFAYLADSPGYDRLVDLSSKGKKRTRPTDSLFCFPRKRQSKREFSS